MRRLGLLASLLFLHACSPNPLDQLIGESKEKGIEVTLHRGFFNPSIDYFLLCSLDSFNKDLDSLYPPLRESFKEAGFYCESLPFSAFVDHENVDFIHFHVFSYTLPTLAHEAAHCREQDVGEEFRHEWISLIDTFFHYLPQFLFEEPRDGFLWWYGSRRCRDSSHFGETRFHEDIATYVEDIYRGCERISLADPTDPRYKEKLKLLRNYDFISEEQFIGATESLGSAFDERVERF